MRHSGSLHSPVLREEAVLEGGGDRYPTASSLFWPSLKPGAGWRPPSLLPLDLSDEEGQGCGGAGGWGGEGLGCLSRGSLHSSSVHSDSDAGVTQLMCKHTHKHYI